MGEEEEWKSDLKAPGQKNIALAHGTHKRPRLYKNTYLGINLLIHTLHELVSFLALVWLCCLDRKAPIPTTTGPANTFHNSLLDQKSKLFQSIASWRYCAIFHELFFLNSFNIDIPKAHYQDCIIKIQGSHKDTYLEYVSS